MREAYWVNIQRKHRIILEHHSDGLQLIRLDSIEELLRQLGAMDLLGAMAQAIRFLVAAG